MYSQQKRQCFAFMNRKNDGTMSENEPKTRPAPSTEQVTTTRTTEPGRIEYELRYEQTLYHRQSKRSWDMKDLTPWQRFAVLAVFVLGFALIIGWGVGLIWYTR
jgi:hypothetical protein